MGKCYNRKCRAEVPQPEGKAHRTHLYCEQCSEIRRKTQEYVRAKEKEGRFRINKL